MDPLSIAASIAGLLTITGAIISKGYAHISQAKKNEGDIAHLLNEVASFAGILLGLKSQYAASEESEISPLQWFAQDSAETWQDTLQTCEKTLTEIKDLVESLASSNSVRLMIKGVSMTSRIEKLLPQIERFKSLFILCLQLQNNIDSKTTNRLTVEVLDLLHRLADKQDLLSQKAEAREHAELRNKIRDWLGPTTEVVQDDIVRGRDPQSCQWLLERPEFLRWLKLDGFTGFWLWGIQGSGKTVIVSKVIETIESDFLEQDDIVVYHYCRFSDCAALSSEKVIGAIVAQLLSKLSDNIPLPELLSKLFNRYRSPPYPSLKELREAFYELCRHSSRVFVIVDGLDEVLDRAGILEFLTDLEVVGAVFKVFVASRPEVDLEANFESYLAVPITQSDVQLDMETYVRQRLEKLQIGDDKDINQEVITTELVERAQGMFLWSVCQIDHLSRIRTAITTDVLTALPRGLENTFEEILLKLEEQDQSLALDILRVISFSERALDVAEVVEAVAVTPTTRNLRQLRNNALRRPNDVFQLCGSLIRKSQTTGKISLSHYSVKEFLSHPFLGKGRRNPFFLHETRSQRPQFETCISYLSLEDFTSETFRETLRLALDPLCTDSDFQVTTSFPFLDYASNYWAPHLKHLSSEDFQAIWPLLKGFLDGKQGSFDSWILISQYSQGEYKFPHGAKSIHVAALYGLEVMLAALLEADSASRTRQTSDGRTPLHIALENHQEGIIDLLLHSPVKTDPLIGKLLIIKDKSGRTPLHTAIESGSEVAVVKLVTVGADANIIQPDGRTPISVAVENQWDSLAEFLSQMADPTQSLSDGRTLLHIAAESGSLSWTTALLKFHGYKLIDAQDGNDWTPLHYAMDREYPHIARALVESGCLIEAYDKNGWTPLHAAIRRRNLECASLILKKDWSGSRPRIANPGPSPSSSRGGPFASGQRTAITRRGADQHVSRRLTPSPSLSGQYAGERRLNRPYESYSVESNVSDLLDVPDLPSTATTRRGADQCVSRRHTPSPSLSGKYADERRRDRPYESYSTRRGADQRVSRRLTPSPPPPGRHADEPHWNRPYELYSVEYSDSDLLDVPDLPRRRKPSPLHLAVTDSYTEGVELLAQHLDKLSRLGSDQEEKLACLDMAIESANNQITLLLMKMLSKRELGWSLLKLVALSSDPIDEYLKTTVPSDDVYAIYIPEAILSNKESVIPSMIRIWPDADETAMHATIRKHPKLAKIFIKNGIALSKVLMEKSQDPLLHRVIAKRDLDFARYLIENGANLEVRNGNGETPLLVLAGLQTTAFSQKEQQTRLDLAQALVQQGADIYALDQRSRDLCHKAACAGNGRFLEWALQTLNSDPNSRDKHSRTSLIKMSSKWELWALLKLVALSSDPIEEYLKTTVPSDDVYAIYIPEAILSNKKSVIPSMIRIWPDADETAMHAIIQKYPKLAKTFTKNGIALSKVLMEKSQNPLLHRVIAERDLDSTRYLVENGANLEVRNGNDETPLLALAGVQTTAFSQKEQQTRLDLAQALVQQGADIYALDQRSRGLCHKAASVGNGRFLEWALRTLNLDPNSRDKNSRTPLLLAVESGLIGTVHLLLKHLPVTEEGVDGADCAPVVDAMEYGNMRSAPLLRAMEARPERNVIIATALVEADEKAFQKLSQARQADLSSLRTAFYIEALTWAIECNFSDGFTFLLPKIAKAALSSLNNVDGDNIYHVAAAATNNEYLKTVLQTLAGQEDFGGKGLNSPNAKSKTPLDIVIECGSEEKAALLLLHGVKPTREQLLKAEGKGIVLLKDLLARETS